MMRDPAVARALGLPFAALEGFLFPDTYAFARGVSARTIAEAMVERFREEYARAEATRGAGVAFDDGRGGDLRLHRREGDRAAGRAAADLLRVPQPAPARHEAADRPDGDVRDDAADRALVEEHHARGPARAPPLQHLHDRRACPPGPSPTPGAAALRAALAPSECRGPLLRVPQRRQPRLLPGPRAATTPPSGSGRSSSSAAAPRGAEPPCAVPPSRGPAAPRGAPRSAARLLAPYAPSRTAFARRRGQRDARHHADGMGLSDRRDAGPAGVLRAALGGHRSRTTSTSSAQNPKVTRTAFQRLYDMILVARQDRVHRQQEEAHPLPLLRRPATIGGKDAIFGLDVPLMKLVNVFKSAAQGYGTEKRVLLLHGPVGSSKSTIARLLKKGLEEYSQDARGRALHLRLGRRARRRPTARAPGADAVPDARGAAAPHPARVARRRSSRELAPPERRLHDPGSTASSAPSAASSSSELMTRVRRRLGQGDRARARAPPRPLARRTASASAPSSPRTRRTRTPPS